MLTSTAVPASTRALVLVPMLVPAPTPMSVLALVLAPMSALAPVRAPGRFRSRTGRR
ncbi:MULTISPECIES: hypothetical protein [unclassified Streptomyces]|uniref:hypothetical protein n=1 Tax=unclassified Streptomyces TaxID=2593676 RepID=UPI00136B39EF|nr:MULTISPECIES: hypothetical protein [unclassified Streptomyces]MYZ41018.1 hypothetical protein [Streptomyces sp. SID4917]